MIGYGVGLILRILAIKKANYLTCMIIGSSAGSIIRLFFDHPNNMALQSNGSHVTETIILHLNPAAYFGL